MNAFTVTAPVVGYDGESCGVVFKDGIGRVTDATKESRAAIEYFRRRGYTLTPRVQTRARNRATRSTPVTRAPSCRRSTRPSTTRTTSSPTSTPS